MQSTRFLAAANLARMQPSLRAQAMPMLRMQTRGIRMQPTKKMMAVPVRTFPDNMEPWDRC